LAEARGRERDLIAEVRECELNLEVEPRTSKILRTKKPVARTSITHPGILEVTQFGPMEIELIGLAAGETSLTFWFAGPDGQVGPEMLRYQVRVAVNEALEDRRRVEYSALERKINELFPGSVVHLFAVANKLIVRGQARDSREAGDIITMVRTEAGDITGGVVNRGADYGYGAGYGGYGYGYGPGFGNPGGRGTYDAQGGRGGRSGFAGNVVNMLEVPGEKLVMLKVRVAELTRTATRDAGSKVNFNLGDFTFTTNLGLDGTVAGVLTTKNLQLTLEALSQNGYSKILAEPNLVTLSGHPASFVSGGSFAVPMVVGVQGASAVANTFQQFGTQITFTPTVLDKDRIRLEVRPSVSSPDKELSVGGVPGLSARAVETTVDLREGEWLAIAGLIQDQQEGSKVRVPGVGDIPGLDLLFSNRHVKRDETELLVLVSPELVHPLEPEEAPLILPGMEVTEPSDFGFYLAGDWEGRPGHDYRSTVAPLATRQGPETRSEAKRSPAYQASENRYIQGPHGFSD
jgi:pilus assembly protein CpaC